MVAYSVVSLPLFGSMQETSTSCAWLMSTWGQKCTIRSLCIDPLLFPKFPLLASAPNSTWSAPSRTAQWANSCTAAARTTCLCSKAGGALYTELIGFETLLTRAYGFLSPCLSAILLISWQLVPWDLLSRTQVHLYPTLLTRVGPTLLTRVGQELDQPFWQELDKSTKPRPNPFAKDVTKDPKPVSQKNKKKQLDKKPSNPNQCLRQLD